jgi:peptidoglycan/xylan/chitin deacetylase (PgdA/CDA1 family)
VAEHVVLHGIGGSPGSTLHGLLGDGIEPFGRYRGEVGSFERVVAAVSGPSAAIAGAGADLPRGPAHAEAVAVRLRRAGHPLRWGEPCRVANVRELLARRAAHGSSAVGVVRADPSLLTELQIGAWFDADWRVRLGRRAALALGRAVVPPAAAGLEGLRLAADSAFWRGTRAAASRDEWLRLTRSSYAALVYHRLAGDRRAGQERVDLDPGRFDRQLRLLRRLGFHHLSADELLAFHERPDLVLPARSFLLTIDDGFRDVLAPLLRHAAAGPQLFVPTAEVGGRAHWLDGEAVLGWDEIRRLAAAGVRVGSHAQRHRRLSGRPPAEVEGELTRSLDDLERELPSPLPAVAYPHGAHDAVVRAAAAGSGFRAGFTTAKGRNGAGTDRFSLRRISVHAADGAPAVLWKALTGETLPRFWPRGR